MSRFPSSEAPTYTTTYTNAKAATYTKIAARPQTRTSVTLMEMPPAGLEPAAPSLGNDGNKTAKGNKPNRIAPYATSSRDKRNRFVGFIRSKFYTKDLYQDLHQETGCVRTHPQPALPCPVTRAGER